MVIMNRFLSLPGAGILSVGVMLLLVPAGRSQIPPPPPNAAPTQPGVEVLTRGPIHEAFAAPSLRNPLPAPVIPKQPPELVEELPPDQKPEGDNALWIPGYWAWNDETNDFLWVSGTYRLVPPGRQWIPGYFSQVQGGWQWTSGFWDDLVKNDLELLPPPPEPIEEAIPPAPAEASIYQPGYWVYQGNRYMWRNGYYVPYRENWVWVPASYYWTPGGYVFNDGYWDYSLQRRGLLFAPVLFANRIGLRPGFTFRPSYLIYDGFLLASLFQRPSYHRYYFGDYYDPRYDRLGYVSWTDARYGRNTGDPLYAYYAMQNRSNPNWVRDQQQLYTTRRTNVAARPPQTLNLQNTVIQNIQNKTVVTNNVTNINTMTAVAPLASVDTARVKLQKVPQNQTAEAQKTATQFREFSTQRAKVEAQARTTTPTPAPVPNAPNPAPAAATPKPIKVALPTTRPAPVKPVEGAKANQPPARPTMPELKPAQPVQPVPPGKGRPPEAPKVNPKKPPEPKPAPPVVPVPNPPANPPVVPQPPVPPGKPPEKPGEKPPGKPGEKPPGKPGEKPPGKPDEKPPGKPDKKPPGKPDDKPPMLG
jgi:hypothetical protein